MRPIPRPAPRIRTRIRFVGGPLDRKTGTTYNRASHRDGDGLPVPQHVAADRIRATRQLGAMASLYFLEPDQSTYRWLPHWVAERYSQEIRRLMQLAVDQPDQADEIEAAIREIERRSVSETERAA